MKSKQIKISKDQNTFFIKSNSFINFQLKLSQLETILSNSLSCQE